METPRVSATALLRHVGEELARRMFDVPFSRAIFTGRHCHPHRFCTLGRRIDSTVHRQSDRYINTIERVDPTLEERCSWWNKRGRSDNVNVRWFRPIERKKKRERAEAFKQKIQNFLTKDKTSKFHYNAFLLLNIYFIGECVRCYSHWCIGASYFPRRLLHGIKPARTEERIDRYLTRVIRRKQMRMYTRGNVAVERRYRGRG